MADGSPRYWVYASEHVVGPYDPDEVQRLPVFGADLPLCAEPLLGTPEEVWRRAADTPGLSRLFPPSQRSKPGEEPKVGPWPPDPERVGDLLATAQERMSIVDRSLEAAQRRLRLRRDATLGVQRELAARAAQVDLLQEKLRTMAVKVGGFLGLKAGLDQARAAMAMQDQREEELMERLARLEAELRASAEEDRAGLLERLAKLEADLRASAAQPPPPPPPPPAAAAPVEEAPKAKRRRKTAGADPLGLGPAEKLDVPDFK